MKTLIRIAAVGMAVLSSGCASLVCATGCHAETRNASSLVEFLYPRGETPPPRNAMPALRLPLRVGLAFLPSSDGVAAPVDQARKQALLEQIREHFRSRPFVSDISVIPDYYLRRGAEFEGLAAVQRLMSVDVMALVSYDQVGHENTNGWSLGYLTIVGAAMLKGTEQDVATLVDLAVVDPVSRSIILRAGGMDVQKTHSTFLDNAARRRELNAASFEAATQQLVVNFDRALVDFEREVREGRSRASITTASGPVGGGGAVDGLVLGLMVLALALRWITAARRG